MFNNVKYNYNWIKSPLCQTLDKAFMEKKFVWQEKFIVVKSLWYKGGDKILRDMLCTSYQTASHHTPSYHTIVFCFLLKSQLIRGQICREYIWQLAMLLAFSHFMVFVSPPYIVSASPALP